MPDLRQLTINAENPNLLARFYQDVFDLEKIGEEGSAVFLSDGIFNLAIVPSQDAMSRGLTRMGFEAARVESIRKRLAQTLNGDRSLTECNGNPGIKYEMRDPDGNVIDLCKRALMCPTRSDRCRYAIWLSIPRVLKGLPIFTVTS